MNAGVQGLLWCLTFVVLEAIQAVFFGGLFQRMDSFLIGALVFAISSTGAIGLALLRMPAEIAVAFANPGALFFVNIYAAAGWIAYLLAVQLVEPAVAFTIFSGAIPLTMIVVAVVIGLLVMAFPIYAVQRSVSLVSVLTIGVITSLGPVFVFGFQIIEGRVDYSPATLTGLLIYFAGALLASAGSSRAARRGDKALTVAP